MKPILFFVLLFLTFPLYSQAQLKQEPKLAFRYPQGQINVEYNEEKANLLIKRGKTLRSLGWGVNLVGVLIGATLTATATDENQELIGRRILWGATGANLVLQVSSILTSTKGKRMLLELEGQ